MNRILLSIFFLVSVVISSAAQGKTTTYKTETDISYRTGEKLTEYQKERCKLDIYFPENVDSFTTVVWFHGGGLTGGEKSIPERLKNHNLAVVAVNYRLSPKVKSPAFIDDAAASIAWVFKNVSKYGGDPKKIIVSGHSAGGYLTSMIGLDKHYLAAYGIDANSIYKLVPFSGQMITHFTIRSERGITGTQPLIDEMAPLYHVRADAPPLYLITGDREMEMLGRYEENAYMWRMMNIVGHKQTTLYELDGFDHGGMAEPAFDLLLKILNK
ncbi:MAG TPA: alpha/beta hydrolase [Prolixibacteraceae bacterium]|nr:alpha/beta hydrolase [Prolixibacteraceae bacterium]